MIITPAGVVVVGPPPDPDPTPDPDTEPPTPGTVAGSDRQFGFSWTGTDGTTWDLARGPVYLLAGARGYGMPTPQHRITQRLSDGGFQTKGRIPPRELYMPVEVNTKYIASLEGQFFAGITPWDEGVHRVTAPDGTWRDLACHYLDGAEGEYEQDPYLVGRSVYPMRMQATDNPYWQGPLVSFTVQQGNAASPFPGPPFTYAPRFSFNNAQVNNLGDVDTHLVGRMEGPFTSFAIDLGDTHVAMTVTKAAGEWVEIDLRPGRQSYRDNRGVNLRALLTRHNPAPIPPGPTSLSMTVSGEGPTTQLSGGFRPNYFRAWGSA